MAGAWTQLHAKVHTHLRQGQLLPKQAKILIAVSGGQDSLCLLRLLLDLQPHWAWNLQVIHCNHRWRPDAEANAEFIQALSQRLHLPCHLETTETPLTSENQARAWRYQVFGDVAQRLNCTHVVTGHTATDQAETLLLHLLRGSGLPGLGGMLTSRRFSPDLPNIQLVRPLLDLTRQDTANFCQEQGLDIWLDTTNADLTVRRNRLRLEIMPPLRQHFNPQADQVLAQTAKIYQAEDDFLTQTVQALYPTVINLERPGLNQATLSTIHPALQRRLIRQFLHAVLAITPTFDHIEAVIRLITAPKNTQSAPLPNNCLAWVDPPWIQFDLPGKQT